MPNYEFEDERGEIHEFFFSMKEAPALGSFIEKDGIKYKRIPSLPNCASNSVEGCPFDKKSFLKATDKQGGTFGHMYDLSKEYAERRKEKDGVDVIGQKANDAAKEAYGAMGITPDDNRAKLASERLKRLGVTAKENKTPSRPKLSRADKRELKEIKRKAQK